MTDLLEHLRELQESRYCFMPGIVRDAADEIVALRQRVKDANQGAERNAIINRELAQELAALKRGQGKPVAWYDPEQGLPYGWTEKPPTENAVHLYVCPAPTIPENTLAHCATCSNRGRINGASQETYCEQCIFQRTWRQDHYAAAPEQVWGLIVALRQQVKELERWRESVLDQCMIAHSTFYANDPKKTLDELIDWHVKITLDLQESRSKEPQND